MSLKRFIIFTVRAICPNRFILLDSISVSFSVCLFSCSLNSTETSRELFIVIIFRERYKLWRRCYLIFSIVLLRKFGLYEEFRSNPVPDSHYFEDLVAKFHITVNDSSEELLESRHWFILLPQPLFGGFKWTQPGCDLIWPRLDGFTILF
jgi:hypothetical protein